MSYRQLLALLADMFPKYGIETTFVNPTNPAEFEAAIRPDTKVIYTETIGNPTLAVADIKALAKIAHAKNIKLVVDNTFTPMMISPAVLGADVVVYSMTKFVNGASDVIVDGVNGFVIDSPDDVEVLADRMSLLLQRSRRVQMGQEAARLRQTVSMERHAAEMIELYKEVLARKTQRGTQ